MKRAVVALAAAALFAGCPGNVPKDASQAAPPKTSTTTVSPRTNAAAPGSPAAVPVVEVDLVDYQIRISDTLPAGPQHFRIANGGHEQHGFAIEGPGVSTQLSSNLTRGDVADLEVRLKPGTYTVWCPMDKHRVRGMERTITVK
jgi:uncharacterized cupredoxin-like copper-binding protein